MNEDAVTVAPALRSPTDETVLIDGDPRVPAHGFVGGAEALSVPVAIATVVGLLVVAFILHKRRSR